MIAYQHPTPSPELLERGHGLAGYAGSNPYRAGHEKNGFAKQNVRKALIGDWAGPKAAALVERVYCEAKRRDAP